MRQNESKIICVSEPGKIEQMKMTDSSRQKSEFHCPDLRQEQEKLKEQDQESKWKRKEE